MFKFKVAVAFGLFLLSVAPVQAEQLKDIAISGNVAITTDYRFRGISQSGSAAAVQGGFDIGAESGWYLGTWASSVNFGNGLEIDFYTGYSGTAGENLGFDIGIIRYHYPSDKQKVDLDYSEVYGSLSFKGFSVGLAYTDNYYQSTGEYFYPYADYSLALSERVSLDAHFGYNMLKDPMLGFFPDNTDAYIDWNIGISANLLDLTWSLALVSTDVGNDATCYDDSTLCSTGLVFSVSKSL